MNVLKYRDFIVLFLILYISLKRNLWKSFTLVPSCRLLLAIGKWSSPNWSRGMLLVLLVVITAGRGKGIISCNCCNGRIHFKFPWLSGWGVWFPIGGVSWHLLSLRSFQVHQETVVPLLCWIYGQMGRSMLRISWIIITAICKYGTWWSSYTFNL